MHAGLKSNFQIFENHHCCHKNSLQISVFTEVKCVSIEKIFSYYLTFASVNLKKYLFILFLPFANCLAQQNFINVPSAEVTVKHKLFFQQQINFNEIIQSNSTLDYGLGKGFEMGINILGLNFSEKNQTFLNNDTNDRDPYNPLIALNGMKSFKLNEKFSLAGGLQAGVNFRDNKKTRGAGLAYMNVRYHSFLNNKGSLVGGLYYNSLHYGGHGNRLGAWVGGEVPLSPRFHLLAESVLGYNAICFTSVAMVYYPKPNMPLTLGLQIPNTSNNAYSVVFEFTIVPE